MREPDEKTPVTLAFSGADVIKVAKVLLMLLGFASFSGGGLLFAREQVLAPATNTEIKALTGTVAELARTVGELSKNVSVLTEQVKAGQEIQLERDRSQDARIRRNEKDLEKIEERLRQ